MALAWTSPLSAQEESPSRVEAIVSENKQSLELKWKNYSYKFIQCPTGSVTIGSPADEEGRSVDEVQKKLEINRSFYLGETETPVWLWKAFHLGEIDADLNPLVLNLDVQQSHPNMPLVMIEIRGVNVLTKELEKALPGMSVRLPTEEEFEYAWRCGKEGPAGGYTKEALLSASNESNFFREVKSLAPNSWGFYDMVDNVDEICSYVERAPLSGIQLQMLQEKNIWFGIRKGASNSRDVKRARAAFRMVSNICSNSRTGFRLLLEQK